MEIKNEDGFTALMWAAYVGNEKTLAALVEKGADIKVCILWSLVLFSHAVAYTYIHIYTYICMYICIYIYIYMYIHIYI
jgi:ankyrin repeat protein